ncbi:sugar transporter family protein [Stylonychia lemnae]|uniref:Sugar transporter family protein n=1 Tax=Stylonychia lemnae TaxID=5949 RepID=A0A078AIN6_STYLE|nr:sugar transporter family protein [Stylonychia lemnae]|eukprot:CDW82084.1 sugar transporter family protein [Stylonychia lemnae]
MLDNIETKQFLTNQLETEKFNLESVRVKKGFIIPYIIVVTLLVSQFGYTIGVINPLIDTLIVKFGWTEDNQSFYISLLSTMIPLGGFFGALIGKSLTLFESVTLIAIGRFIQGIAACGFSTVIVPKFSKKINPIIIVVYETSPVSMRGPLGGLTQLQIFTGIILVFTLGFGTPETHEDKLNSQYWRLVFFIPIIIAVLQSVLLLLFFKYETPIFSIVQKNKDDEARQILRRIYYEEDVPNIIQAIKDNNKSQTGGGQQSFADAIFGVDCKSAWVGFFLQFFNQLSGINCVNLYSSKIFEQSGMDPKFGTWLVGVFNFIGAIIPMIIINSNYLTQLYANYRIMLLMIILYLVFYQLGAGPIPYIYITDICSDAGMSFGTLSMWLWSLFTTIVTPFLIMNEKIGITGCFAGLTVLTFIGFIFCLLVLKETKGLTDDQCKKLFSKQETTKK